MTTSLPDIPAPDREEHPWEMVDEFRVGEIFIRVMQRSAPEEREDDFEFILAKSAAGLDDPHAFRFADAYHLDNAIGLAGTMCSLSMSSSMSEERIFNREFVRRGAVSVDQEPPPWIDTPWLYPNADSPPEGEPPSPRGEPYCQHFAAGGLYGRVHGAAGADRDSFAVSFASNPYDLGTYRELTIGSHAGAYKALWAAAVLIDMGAEMSSRTAFGYRELAKQGVTLITPHEQAS